MNKSQEASQAAFSFARFKLFIPLIIFIVMALFLYRGLSIDPSKLPTVLENKPLPAFSLPELVLEAPEEGQLANMVSDKDLMGEAFLLNIWATWCAPCRIEHPYLIKLAEQGVKIVGVDSKDEDDEARKWLQRLGNPYAVNIVDKNGRLGVDLGVYGYPETFVIDANGIVRYRHVGIVDEKVWKELLEPHLTPN